MASDLTNSARLRRNFEMVAQLHEAGVLMMRQNLKRRDPDATPEEIEVRLVKWIEGHPLLGERVEVSPSAEVCRDRSA